MGVLHILVAAGVAIALAPAARADPNTDATDRFYFRELAKENFNQYNPTHPTHWSITDPTLAIETGHWVCDRVRVDDPMTHQVEQDLITRSRTAPWGFVWSSPDPLDEEIGALGIEIAAREAYCPESYTPPYTRPPGDS